MKKSLTFLLCVFAAQYGFADETDISAQNPNYQTNVRYQNNPNMNPTDYSARDARYDSDSQRSAQDNYGMSCGSSGGPSGYSAPSYGSASCCPAETSCCPTTADVEPGRDYPCENGQCISYCPVVKYCPQYYNETKCEYVPQYSYKRCCRYVPQYYQRQCCRYVPQYYCQTYCCQVPQYYYTCECTQCPRYYCEQKCRYVPQYSYKKVCTPEKECMPEVEAACK